LADIALVLLALTVLLVLVSLSMPLADRLALPHSVLLAVLGLVLGGVAISMEAMTAMPESLGIVGDSLRGLGDLGLTAEVFLFLFLPPLLFASGLSIDVRLLFDEIAAVLLLAVVAVVVCTLVVGLALGLAVVENLAGCLLLGAVVAATDPAAVVGIFRDLGAPRRLSTLVAGESLFNDAAAIALFAILLAIVTGERAPDLLGATVDFLFDFAGGAALGYLLARALCLLFARWAMAPVAQITLTLALAYGAYILGEAYLLVSGVVAVVSASLAFAVHGRGQLNPATWDTLHDTWSQLEFWANSLIIVLAAVLAAHILPDTGLTDLGLLMIVVASALAARGLVLYLLLPAMTALGLAQAVSRPYRAVILWGGLRGAVTLVLALSISQNVEVPAPEQILISKLAVAFVLFTLFVNAPTLRRLIRLLGLDRLSPVELALRDRVMALSRATIREQIQAVGRDYGFEPAIAAQVAASVSCGPGETPGDRGVDQEPDQEGAVDLGPETRLAVGLQALANRERELCLGHFKAGTISRRMVSSILAFADRRIDRVKDAGGEGYEASTAQEIRMPRGLRGTLLLHRHLGFDRLLGRQLAEHFETLLIFQLLVRALLRFNRGSVRPILGPETSNALDAILRSRLQAVEGALTAVEVQYPRYAEALRSQYLARSALRFEEAEYRLKLEESLVTREVFASLMASLRQRRHEVERQPPLELGSGLVEMLRRVEVFAGFDEARLGQIVKLLRPRLAIPGEVVVSRGARGDTMYFIASGQVEVRLVTNRVTLVPGDFFGEIALLTRRPRTADVVATRYCHLLVLEARDFQRLLRANPEVRATIERVAQERLADDGRRGEPAADAEAGREERQGAG